MTYLLAVEEQIEHDRLSGTNRAFTALGKPSDTDSHMDRHHKYAVERCAEEMVSLLIDTNRQRLVLRRPRGYFCSLGLLSSVYSLAPSK